jgi:hypothetical protein
VRVPDDIDPGKAIIRVHVPKLKERVTPLEIAVPVEGASPGKPPK